MAARRREERYSSRYTGSNSLLTYDRPASMDRVDKLAQMSISSHVVSHAKLKKRRKVKDQVSTADSITFLPDGSRLLVSDLAGGRLVIFDDGAKKPEVVMTDVHPRGVAGIDSRTFAFIDEDPSDAACVKIISLDGGEDSNTIRMVGKWQRDTGPWRPRGVAVTRTGQIVVTNTHPDASERFWMVTPDGGDAKSFGRAQGPADLVFRTPNYVTADEFGRILATDTAGDCVKVFDSRCRYVTEFPRGRGVNSTPASAGESKLSSPTGIATDSRGNVIVCDAGNRRLVLFSHDGRFVQDLRRPQRAGLTPADVAVSAGGDRLSLSVHDALGNFKKMVLYDYICG